jgi:hypothetical protein
MPPPVKSGQQGCPSTSWHVSRCAPCKLCTEAPASSALPHASQTSITEAQGQVGTGKATASVEQQKHTSHTAVAQRPRVKDADKFQPLLTPLAAAPLMNNIANNIVSRFSGTH